MDLSVELQVCLGVKSLEVNSKDVVRRLDWQMGRYWEGRLRYHHWPGGTSCRGTSFPSLPRRPAQPARAASHWEAAAPPGPRWAVRGRWRTAASRKLLYRDSPWNLSASWRRCSRGWPCSNTERATGGPGGPAEGPGRPWPPLPLRPLSCRTRERRTSASRNGPQISYTIALQLSEPFEMFSYFYWFKELVRRQTCHLVIQILIAGRKCIILGQWKQSRSRFKFILWDRLWLVNSVYSPVMSIITVYDIRQSRQSDRAGAGPANN